MNHQILDALAFYADSKSYSSGHNGPDVMRDLGVKAKEALALSERRHCLDVDLLFRGCQLDASPASQWAPDAQVLGMPQIRALIDAWQRGDLVIRGDRLIIECLNEPQSTATEEASK